MDGLLQSIGRGIVGLVEGALDTIGDVVRGLFGQVDSVLPVPFLAVIAVGVVGVLAWNLVRR